MTSEKLNRVWRPLQPSNRNDFGKYSVGPITDLVFSPSGRYAVDVNKRSTISGTAILLVVVVDMVTMQKKKLDTSALNSVQEVMNTYWISECDIVVVGFDHQNNFIQAYCSLRMDTETIDVNHEIRTKSTALRIHKHPGMKDMIRNNGINPLYLNGGRYCLLNNFDCLTLVPWDVNYTIEQCYQIRTEVLLEIEGFTCYGPSFCLGSKIYCSVIERDFDVDTAGRALHRIYTDRMICIDVALLEFNDRKAELTMDSVAISLVKFTKVTCNSNSTLNSVNYHQHGQFVIATEKLFLPPNSVVPKSHKHSIWVIDLKAQTVHHTTLVNDNTPFFVFIYNGYLFAIRDLLNQQNPIWTWDIDYLTICYRKNEITSLYSLCKKSITVRRVPMHRDFMNILFPEVHCCIPTMANYDPDEKRFTCHCSKTSTPKTTTFRMFLDPASD